MLDGGDPKAKAGLGVESEAVLQRGEASFNVADHAGGRVDYHLASGPGRQPPLGLYEDEQAVATLMEGAVPLDDVHVSRLVHARPEGPDVSPA